MKLNRIVLLSAMLVTALANTTFAQSLRSAYDGAFLIGTALSTNQILEKDPVQAALVAKEFNVPVHVLTQPSRGVATGKDIPIEIRDEDELLKVRGKRFVRKGVKGFYPGFDVLPHELITETIAINVN